MISGEGDACDQAQHHNHQCRHTDELDEFKGRWEMLAKERGRLTITDAVTLLQVNRNTAKVHIRQLVEGGYLVQHGTGRATWYTAGK